MPTLSLRAAQRQAENALYFAIADTGFRAESWNKLANTFSKNHEHDLQQTLIARTKVVMRYIQDFCEKRNIAVMVVAPRLQNKMESDNPLIVTNFLPAAKKEDPDTWGANAVVINPLITQQALAQHFTGDLKEVLATDPTYGRVMPAFLMAKNLLLRSREEVDNVATFVWQHYQKSTHTFQAASATNQNVRETSSLVAQSLFVRASTAALESQTRKAAEQSLLTVRRAKL